MGNTFGDCSLVLPNNVTPQDFVEKTFANSHKTLKFAKVCSLESFPLYTVYGFCLVLQILEAGSHQVSYVMVRGSVPVFWTQPGYKYRPPPIIEKGDTHMSAIYVPRLSHTSVVKYTLLVVSTQERRRLRRLLGSTLKNSLVSINSR